MLNKCRDGTESPPNPTFSVRAQAAKLRRANPLHAFIRFRLQQFKERCENLAIAICKIKPQKYVTQIAQIAKIDRNNSVMQIDKNKGYALFQTVTSRYASNQLIGTFSKRA